MLRRLLSPVSRASRVEQAFAACRPTTANACGPVRTIAIAAALAFVGVFVGATSGCAGSQGKSAAAAEPGPGDAAQVATLAARVAALEEQNRELGQRLANVEAQTVATSTLVSRIEEALRAAEPPTRRPPGPDPEAVYAVPIEGSPSEGPKDAVITIVKAFEFACPYCERSRSTLEQIRNRYGDDVRIVYKSFIVHQGQAEIPAQAVCAAHLQNRFTDMKTAIWEKAYKADRDLSRRRMNALAREVGLDFAAFRRDIDGRCAEIVAKEHATMAGFGVTGTPMFFINGRSLRGAQPLPAFIALIDQELDKAKRLLETGVVTKKGYYDYILQNGRKQL